MEGRQRKGRGQKRGGLGANWVAVASTPHLIASTVAFLLAFPYNSGREGSAGRQNGVAAFSLPGTPLPSRGSIASPGGEGGGGCRRCPPLNLAVVGGGGSSRSTSRGMSANDKVGGGRRRARGAWGGARGRSGAGQLNMLWSGGRRTAGDEVTVNIERPSMNSRRISGSIVIDRPIEDVWLTLTDYDKLADYVPNLVQSKQLEHPGGGIRLFQEGAQNIVGFDFRASLTMDMEEQYGDAGNLLAMRKIGFSLVDSVMFKAFDGEWRMQSNSRKVNKDAKPGEPKYIYTTKLFYMLLIKPKGPVPVIVLEAQVSNEVPNNLKGLKAAAENKAAEDPGYFERRKRQMAMRTLTSGLVVNNEKKTALQMREEGIWDCQLPEDGDDPLLEGGGRGGGEIGGGISQQLGSITELRDAGEKQQQQQQGGGGAAATAGVGGGGGGGGAVGDAAAAGAKGGAEVGGRKGVWQAWSSRVGRKQKLGEKVAEKVAQGPSSSLLKPKGPLAAGMRRRADWESDETLEAYIEEIKSRENNRR